MRALTTAVSLATCAVSGWMFVMYFVLRHPGYAARAAIAAAVFAGAATLVSGRPLPGLRIPVIIWGIAVAALGVWALVSAAEDGWVIVAGLLFAIEGSCAVTSSAVSA